MNAVDQIVNSGSTMILLAHPVGSKVNIKDIGVNGRVSAINIGYIAVSYCVRYFDDEKVFREVWLLANELESA